MNLCKFLISCDNVYHSSYFIPFGMFSNILANNFIWYLFLSLQKQMSSFPYSLHTFSIAFVILLTPYRNRQRSEKLLQNLVDKLIISTNKTFILLAVN